MLLAMENQAPNNLVSTPTPANSDLPFTGAQNPFGLRHSYRIDVVTVDPANGKPLPLPSVSVLKGRVKVCKVFGSEIVPMVEKARYIIKALEAFEATAVPA